MMDDVRKAVENNRHLIADAPTGLGKTAASLFPALEYAVTHDKTVFFLTSRLSQHKMAIDTVRMIKDAGNVLSAVDIVGKRHLCSQDVKDMDSGEFNNYCRAMVKDKRCTYYKNSNAADLASERNNIIRLLAARTPGTEEAMKLAGGRYCTYEMLMDAGRHASVVIGDYFHLFGIGESFFKRLGKNISDAIIIVDEAHNLAPRLRDYLSSSLSTWTCNAAGKEARNFTEFEARDIISQIGKKVEALGKRKLFTSTEQFVERDELYDIINSVGSYDKILSTFKRIGEGVLEERKVSYVDRLAEFLSLWQREGPGYARIISRQKFQGKDAIMINFSCMDPSIIARPIIQSSHSTVLMSGTLSPMEMHRDLLGLEPDRTSMKSYESPFPKANRMNIIYAGLTTAYKERSTAGYAKIASFLSVTLRSIKGNAAVFFPSYAIRDTVHDIMKTDKHVILEESSMTKKERDNVADDLKKHAANGAVLLGVMGGSFSEGVDLPGDLLNGVIIIGLPLDRPSLSSKALIDYYDQRFGRGRDYGYNFPAMIKVMQAAGRCIRTEADRGVIVFADGRFLWKNYRELFPRSWDFSISARPQDEIKTFFSI